LLALGPPSDPLIYRFYELVSIYGTTWKARIDEEFGDGIMSAIDFDMAMERVADPKGDRVKITMAGKFLRTSVTETTAERARRKKIQIAHRVCVVASVAEHPRRRHRVRHAVMGFHRLAAELRTVVVIV